MTTNELEEKINKIRQQNEEIQRRHKEVEEDKKNAAKLNALVQMVPSTDWPERKEPLEFHNPPRANNKVKHVKSEHLEHPQQHQSTSGEGRKSHMFAQGQGPPPDPKYNFLADAERETGNMEDTKETLSNRDQKHSRGTFRKKPGGKDGIQRDYRTNKGSHREKHQPGYEAWRAERNRIDEDRISRQRTAEGNWRREWDNDKAHIVDEMSRSDARLGDYVKKDHKDFDRRYHVNGNDYYNRGGSHRSYRGNSRYFHNNYENRSNNAYHQDGHIKNPVSSVSEERTVIATDKSIKVTLNQGNMAKGPVTSVKVNSPSIAGTGRVGPRQRSRITYSSHSDVEATSPDIESSRQKSYEDKTKGIYHDHFQRSSNTRKSQPSLRKDFGNKSSYFRKKDIGREDVNENLQKHHETESLQESKESQKSYQSKSQKFKKNSAKSLLEDKKINKKENVISDESNMKNIDAKDKDNQNDYSNSCVNDVKSNEVNQENESIFQNSDSSAINVETKIDTSETSEQLENKSEELQIIQTVVSKTTDADLITSIKDTNDDENEIKSANNCDSKQIENVDEQKNDIENVDEQKNNIENINEQKNNIENVDEQKNDIENVDEQKNDIENVDEQKNNIENINEQKNNIENVNEQKNDIGNVDEQKNDIENVDEQKNDIKDETKEDFLEEKVTDKITIPFSTDDVSSTAKENNELSSDDNGLKKKNISIADDADKHINTDDQQDAIKSINEIQECTNDKEENNAANNSVVDTTEFPEDDMQVENKEATSLKIIETEK